jgi:hypothetical protein
MKIKLFVKSIIGATTEKWAEMLSAANPLQHFAYSYCNFSILGINNQKQNGAEYKTKIKNIVQSCNTEATCFDS